MKKLTTAIASLLGCGSIASAAIDLDVFPFGGWEIVQDEIGSTGKITDSTDTKITAELDFFKSTKDPYVSLSENLDSVFTGVTGIEITYSSDKPLLVSLGDTASTYGYSSKAVLAEGENKTVKLTIPDDFEFIWGPSETEETPLNLSEVMGFSLDAVTQGEKTTLSVTAVKLYNYTYDTTSESSILSNKNLVAPFQVSQISAKSMDLSVPVAGNYSIEISTYSGRILKTVETKLNVGNNVIALDGLAISNQMVAIKISGNSQVETIQAIIK